MSRATTNRDLMVFIFFLLGVSKCRNYGMKTITMGDVTSFLVFLCYATNAFHRPSTEGLLFLFYWITRQTASEFAPDLAVDFAEHDSSVDLAITKQWQLLQSFAALLVVLREYA